MNFGQLKTGDVFRFKGAGWDRAGTGPFRKLPGRRNYCDHTGETVRIASSFNRSAPPRVVHRVDKTDIPVVRELRAREHGHECRRCLLTYECGNGPDCDLSDIDGFCSQSCYDKGGR